MEHFILKYESHRNLIYWKLLILKLYLSTREIDNFLFQSFLSDEMKYLEYLATIVCENAVNLKCKIARSGRYYIFGLKNY